MVMKKKIIVVPQAGLGNRMRVLASAVQLAKRDNRELWIAWPVNAALGCEMTDIFQSIGMDYSVPPKWINFLLTNIYRPGTNSRFYGFLKFVSKFFAGQTLFDNDIRDDRNNRVKQLKISSEESTVLVATCFPFGDQPVEEVYNDYMKNEELAEQFANFKFSEILKERVKQEYQKIGEPYIGIHIRRTDHVHTIKDSPDENYITQIDRYLAENPNQNFLLATDDEPTKVFFKQKYGSQMHIFNHKIGRDDLEGIYGGVVELLMLANSRKIICSCKSSYSNTAIVLGGIKDIVYIDTHVFDVAKQIQA